MRQMCAVVDPTAIGRASVLGLAALLAVTLVAAYPTPSHAQRIPSRNLSIRYYGVSNIGEPAIDRPDVGGVGKYETTLTWEANYGGPVSVGATASMQFEVLRGTIAVEFPEGQYSTAKDNCSGDLVLVPEATVSLMYGFPSAGLVVDHDSLSLIGPISNAGFLKPDPGAKAACNPGGNLSLARLPAAVKNDPSSSALVSAFDTATHPTIALPDTSTASARFSQHFGFTYPDPYNVGTGPDSPHKVFIQSDVEITPLGDSIFDNENGP